MKTDLKAVLPVESREIGTQLEQTIDARKLHAWLGVGKDFSNWLKDRIRKYEFVENQDFVTVEGFSPESAKTSKGGRPSKEYHITTDMAKELAMVENNQRGREARRYFIAMEKAAIEQLKAAIPTPEQVAQHHAMRFIAHSLPACPYGTLTKDGRKRDRYRKPTFTATGNKLRQAREVAAALLLIENYLPGLRSLFLEGAR